MILDSEQVVAGWLGYFASSSGNVFLLSHGAPERLGHSDGQLCILTGMNGGNVGLLSLSPSGGRPANTEQIQAIIKSGQPTMMVTVILSTKLINGPKSRYETGACRLVIHQNNTSIKVIHCRGAKYGIPRRQQ